MKIVHVITTLDVGGAEMHLLAQVRGQVERGHAVRVVHLKGAGTLAADFRAAGAELVTSISPARALLGLRAQARWADIVHSHLLKADMLCAASLAFPRTHARLVASKHNDEQVLTRGSVSRIHGVLGRVPERTIVLSDHVARFMVEHGRLDARALVRIYYGLEPRPFELARELARAGERERARAELGFERDAIVFICVARFAPQKAHADLLRGFDLACKARTSRATGAPPLRLLLVGDDPFGDGRARAEAVARELQLGPAVLFAGIRRDVPRLLAASDAFVMTSLWEGLGLVFLEAMACGLPVVATRVSAVPEVVVDESTGLLVPPRDAPALAAALTRIADEPALRERLGTNGRARVREGFDLARMIDATLDVYREVLSGAGAPGHRRA